MRGGDRQDIGIDRGSSLTSTRSLKALVSPQHSGLMRNDVTLAPL
jgi:hypothetical protein